jgi:hypothetical protein
MKRIVAPAILVACLAIARPTAAQSTDQTYKNAVGVTFGWWNGASVSVKHFFNENTVGEVRVSFWQYGGEVCGLYEHYEDFGTVPGLKWYAGVGGHGGSHNNGYAKYYPSRTDGLYAGPDGILGVDYKFSGAPIDVSFDVQPRLDIPGPYFSVWGGLGVRFAF